MNKHWGRIMVLAGGLLLLGGCSSNPASDNDGWVRNVPGQPHTHENIVLPDCPDEPMTITHVHEGDKASVGLHKHDGCFVCPPKKGGVKRILQ